jgi:hypothetical protein
MRWSLPLPRLHRSSKPSRKPSRPRKPQWRPEVETLEERMVLSASLSMSGSQTLVAGPNVNASNNTLTGESEMQVAINPANPLQVVDFTHNVNNLNQMSVYHSSDGGLTWSRTIISNTNDGLGTGTRFDPTLKLDADGHLFIAYGFDNGNNTTLVTARSDDGGSTFSRFRFPDSNGDNHSLPGVDKWFLTTGLDPSTGGQAVYIAYTHNANEVLGLDQQITVVGSNDGGNTYTAPLNIDDNSNSFFGLGRDSSLFAAPAVGPNGELYVVWHDLDDGQLKFDRDLDGLWGNSSHFGSDVVVKTLRESFLGKITPASPIRGFANGPSIDVSRSNPFQGRIYVAFTDTFSGNDTDIYLVSSDDNGSSWTSVGSVGNVEGSTGTDFMATVAVDPTSSSVNVGYYTTDGEQSGADGIANDDVNYRVASSIDDGATWSHVNLSSATSRASAMGNGNEFGDYVGLAAYGGTVRGFWTDNRGQTADTEAFTATASFSSATSGNTLVVFGTDLADTIEVMRSPSNSAYVEVFVNCQNQFTGLWSSVNHIVVSGLGGDDSIYIDDAASGVPISVFGNDGNDTIHIALPSGDLGHVAGPISVDGGTGSDTVSLWNDLTSTGRTYTVTSSTVSVAGSAFGGLSYTGIEGLTINAGSGNDTVNVISTASATPLTVNAGAGDDMVNVGTGDLDTVQGAVAVNGQAGTDTVNLMDQTAPYDDIYTISSTAVSRQLRTGGPTAFGGLSYGTIEGLTLNAETGDNLINVPSTASSTPVTVNAGAGNDVINIQPSTPFGISSLDTLSGAVTVNGQGGSDTVNINDQADAFNGDSYTITSSTVQRNAMALVTYGTIENLVINGAASAAISYHVNSTLSTTPVTISGGSGSDMLVGPNLINTWTITGTNQGRVGNVTFTSMDNLTGGANNDVFVFGNAASRITGIVNGGGGINSLDYSQYPSGVTVQLANSPAMGTATATGGVLNIQNVAGSHFNDTLIGNDQDNVFTTYGGRDTILCNGGNDTVRIVGLQDPASTIDGGSGSNLLWANDGTNTWTLSGVGSGSLAGTVSSNPSAAMPFTNFQQVLGGLGSDTFRILPGASFTYLNGNGGVNWLDYSAYTSQVTVNLATSTATGVVGANCFNIENVIGSRSAANTLTGNAAPLGNILVGGNAADTITAGTARSILIGGLGADVITGGTADDIVIGGFTDYDQNQAALSAIMGEWRSSADVYLTRISKIRAGIVSGANTYSLIWGSGPGTTVHDDNAADTLRGDPATATTRGMDWFFANPATGTLDMILDQQMGEKVDNQP